MAKPVQYSLDETRVGTPGKHRGRHANPPGPRGLPFLGSLLDVKRDRLAFLDELSESFGDVTMFRMGPTPVYFVNCPDGVRRVLRDNYRNYKKGVGLTQAKPLIGEGLLTSEGALWQRQRRMAHVAFDRRNVDRYGSAMTTAVESMLVRWDEANEYRRPVNILSEMSRLTLDILVRCLLGTDGVYRADVVETAFRVATEYAIHRMTSLFEFTAWLPTPRNIRFSRALKDLNEVVCDVIDGRRKAADRPPDLLTELLRARDDDGVGMSDKQLRDEVMTILLAGHETTASTLAWVWYLLAKNPAAERRLRYEAQLVLGGRTPSAVDLAKISYVGMVLKETMRLYPAVWLIPRKAIRADVVSGFEIPQGADVIISPYTLHRHKAHWPKPEEFQPERFDPAISHGWDQDVYIPFGMGPRACVGKGMATLETELIVLSIIQRYSLRQTPGSKMVPSPLLTLRPDGDLMMTLETVGAERFQT